MTQKDLVRRIEENPQSRGLDEEAILDILNSGENFGEDIIPTSLIKSNGKIYCVIPLPNGTTGLYDLTGINTEGGYHC